MVSETATPRTTLAIGSHLFATCASCRHRGEIDLDDLIEHGLGDTALTSLPLWCSDCGSRAVELTVPGPQPASGQIIGGR